MRTIIAITILTLISTSGFSQKEIPKEDKTYMMEINSKDFVEKITIARHNPTRLKTNNLLWYYWYLNNSVHFSEGGYSGKLLQGIYISYYKNMNLRSNGYFRNGLMHGIWKSWYENGKAKSVVSWKKGVKQGLSTSYSDDGNIRIEENYRHGLIDGKQKIYENGVLVSVKKFNKGVEKVKRHQADTIATDSIVQQTTNPISSDTIPTKSKKVKKKKVSENGSETNSTEAPKHSEATDETTSAPKHKWWTFWSKKSEE